MAKVIGFTNGCFQLLHLGHIHLLTEARKYCDTLIVGVNSDESIKKLKGYRRFVETVQLRRMALLPFCDAVIEFDDFAPYELILSLRPHVLIKGDEGEKPIGWDIVMKTVLIPKIEGYSTTSEIAKRRA